MATVTPTQKITPFLWFDTQAEEAAKFYVSLFPGSKILGMSHYSDAGPGPKGSVMGVSFELAGMQIQALNGGPHYKLSPAFSLFVTCDDAAEVDRLWEKLTAGGKEIKCGWLVDRFGVSWQIVPREFTELLGSGDSRKVGAMMKAMMSMEKLDIAALKKAYAAG